MNQLELINESGLPTEESARAAANDGMQRAVDHAEIESPGWVSLAYHFLTNFCLTHEYFISEDVSDASKAWGMVQPPTDKAWGQIYRRAIKAAVIVQDGAGKSRRRHCSICPRWKSLLYRSAA